MMDEAEKVAIAERYLRFARHEAHGQSALYKALSNHVAANDRLLGFLSGLPADRQQPNLLFAAVRLVAGIPDDIAALDEAIETHGPAIANVMRTRTTQTNEPGRCAVLLPVFSRLPQPLALLEVGASAGLCLLPDKYGYDYGQRTISAPNAAAPIFPCEVNELTPMPASPPMISWRAGLELNPLKVGQQSDAEWLETLVWPEHVGRRDRLRAAIAIARQEPPLVIQGSLLSDLASVLKSMPDGATRVVFHTAVLAYISLQADRDEFARNVRRSGAIWVSNEAPGVFPDIAAKLTEPIRRDRFLLAVDGEPVAWTGPHGQSIEWIARR
jgi:hypothetical protein